MTLSGRSAVIVAVGGIVSLCLNLFLIGLLVGGLWHGPHHGWGSGPVAADDRPSGEPSKIGFMTVPPEIRKELKDVLAPHEAEIDRMRDAMRLARAEVAKQLSADPFDPAAFEQALDTMQQQGQVAQQMMHGLIVEAAPKLSPEMRQRWAKRWLAPRDDAGRTSPEDQSNNDQAK
ncbi:periplasmic heavy metal sensor [Dongia soli]|uniref:Periplasmic heavy metal sensor n=1 Tax=Dongia soli TaxID=600628 RepID=A0ABU5E7Z0_9PROT|nr:periplasmic heavy metal sensor [Dongia soli]MDY0882462.1 periplasmic heavy metal sensor [Dongia soli]